MARLHPAVRSLLSRRSGPLPALSLLLALNGAAPAALAFQGQAYHVDASLGDDMTGDGSPGAPWRTISRALSSTVSTDEVVVASGVYDVSLGEVFPLNVPPGVRVTSGSQNSPNGLPPNVVPPSGTSAFIFNALTDEPAGLEGLKVNNIGLPVLGLAPLVSVNVATPGGALRLLQNQFEIGEEMTAVAVEGRPGSLEIDGNQVSGDSDSTFLDIDLWQGADSSIRVVFNQSDQAGYRFSLDGAQVELFDFNDNVMLDGEVRLDARNAVAENLTIGENRFSDTDTHLNWVAGMSSEIQIFDNEFTNSGLRWVAEDLHVMSEVLVTDNRLHSGTFLNGSSPAGSPAGSITFTLFDSTLSDLTVRDNAFRSGTRWRLSLDSGAAVDSLSVTDNRVIGGRLDVDARLFSRIDGLSILRNELESVPDMALQAGGEIRITASQGSVIDTADIIDNRLEGTEATIAASASRGSELNDVMIRGNDLLALVDVMEAAGSDRGGNIEVNASSNSSLQSLSILSNRLFGETDAHGEPLKAGQIRVSTVDSHADVKIERNEVEASYADAISISVLDEDDFRPRSLQFRVRENTLDRASNSGVGFRSRNENSGSTTFCQLALETNRIFQCERNALGIQYRMIGAGNVHTLELDVHDNQLLGNQNGLEIEATASGLTNEFNFNGRVEGNSTSYSGSRGMRLTRFYDGAVVAEDLSVTYNRVLENDGVGIESSVFTNLQSAQGVGDDSMVTVAERFQGNTIRENAFAGVVIRNGSDSPEQLTASVSTVLRFNSLSLNGQGQPGDGPTNGQDLIIAPVNEALPVDARSNWWGTTDLLEIEDRVTHFVDDPERGAVDFTDPLEPGVLELEPFEDFASTFSTTIEVNAQAPYGFVPFVGASTPSSSPVGDGGELGRTSLSGTLGGLAIEVVEAAADGSALSILTPAGLPYGPAELVLQDPDGNVGTLTINVNDPPVCFADLASTTQKTPVTIDVLDNDSDPNGRIDAASLTILTGPSDGNILSIDPESGEITYLPDASFVGTDRIVYQVRDDQGMAGNETEVAVVVRSGCDILVYCEGTPTAMGPAPQIGVRGFPSASTDNFSITITGGLPGTFARGFYSVAGPDFVPFLNGTLCVRRPLRRLPAIQLDGNGYGGFPIAIEPSMVGTTRWYQMLHRAGPEVGFSDAVRVTFCE